MGQEYTIQDVATQLDMSTHTLRYYEREGLIAHIKRAANTHRRYSQDDIEWIEFLQCLRQSGMGIRQMHALAELRQQRPYPLKEIVTLLGAYQQELAEAIQERQESLHTIEQKIGHYNEAIRINKKITGDNQ